MGQYYSDTPFQNAYSYFDQAAKAALPSPESMDQAAARLRSRTDGYANAQRQQIQDQYASRGMGNSGAYQLAQTRNNMAANNSYASGLADIQKDWWDQQQTGAQTLSQIGQGYGQTASSQAESGINDALGSGKLNIEQQNANTNRQQSITDLLTAFGTVGGALGGNTTYGGQTAEGFNQLKQYLFSILGMNY